MKTFSLIAASAVLFLSACDRHEWKSKDGEMGTKELYKHGEEGHGDAHGAHGAKSNDDEKAHAEKGDHKEEEAAH